MSGAFEQARAMYGSDEQMARALFEQLAIMRLELELQQALRRRAEDQLPQKRNQTRNISNNEGTK